MPQHIHHCASLTLRACYIKITMSSHFPMASTAFSIPHLPRQIFSFFSLVRHWCQRFTGLFQHHPFCCLAFGGYQSTTNQPTPSSCYCFFLRIAYQRDIDNFCGFLFRVVFSASTSTLHCGLLLSSALTHLASYVTERRLMKTPIRYSASSPTETSRVFPIQETEPPRQGKFHQQTPPLTHTDSRTSPYTYYRDIVSHFAEALPANSSVQTCVE